MLFNSYAVIPPTPHYSVNEVDIVVYLGSSILIFPFTTRRCVQGSYRTLRLFVSFFFGIFMYLLCIINCDFFMAAGVTRFSVI